MDFTRTNEKSQRSPLCLYLQGVSHWQLLYTNSVVIEETRWCKQCRNRQTVDVDLSTIYRLLNDLSCIKGLTIRAATTVLSVAVTTAWYTEENNRKYWSPVIGTNIYNKTTPKPQVYGVQTQILE